MEPMDASGPMPSSRNKRCMNMKHATRLTLLTTLTLTMLVLVTTCYRSTAFVTTSPDTLTTAPDSPRLPAVASVFGETIYETYKICTIFQKKRFYVLHYFSVKIEEMQRSSVFCRIRHETLHLAL